MRYLIFLLFAACATFEADKGNLPYNPYEASTYVRDDWGRWRDDDKDCQDTRAEILIRDSEAPVVFAEGASCRVVSGQWTDPYTGQKVYDASLLDIDHIVPLEEAHLSGGWSWDRDRKRNFSNDFSNLVAAGRSVNRSKGSRGPQLWLPPNEPQRCLYISKYLEIKKAWDLNSSVAEFAVTSYMLHICQTGGTPPIPQKV